MPEIQIVLSNTEVEHLPSQIQHTTSPQIQGSVNRVVTLQGQRHAVVSHVVRILTHLRSLTGIQSDEYSVELVSGEVIIGTLKAIVPQLHQLLGAGGSSYTPGDEKKKSQQRENLWLHVPITGIGSGTIGNRNLLSESQMAFEGFIVNL